MTREAAPNAGGVAGQREEGMVLGRRRHQGGCDLPNAGELGLCVVRVPSPDPCCRKMLNHSVASVAPAPRSSGKMRKERERFPASGQGSASAP